MTLSGRLPAHYTRTVRTYDWRTVVASDPLAVPEYPWVHADPQPPGRRHAPVDLQHVINSDSGATQLPRAGHHRMSGEQRHTTAGELSTGLRLRPAGRSGRHAAGT